MTTVQQVAQLAGSFFLGATSVGVMAYCCSTSHHSKPQYEMLRTPDGNGIIVKQNYGMEHIEWTQGSYVSKNYDGFPRIRRYTLTPEQEQKM
jgi:hypothetical protein